MGDGVAAMAGDGDAPAGIGDGAADGVAVAGDGVGADGAWVSGGAGGGEAGVSAGLRSGLGHRTITIPGSMDMTPRLMSSTRTRSNSTWS